MISYKDAGVDVKRGEESVKRIKKHTEKTFTDKVLKGVSAFAGAWDATVFKEMKNPVLLSSIDGVGTKTVIAAKLNRWENIGRDIVGHSGNDLVCQGAKPLLFLDYIASSALSPETIEIIVKGMAEACTELGCVLIGGETAEMPQVYCEGAHDVVGAIIGVVDRTQMITGENIKEGDSLIALPSNGLHTNGYSLARKVLTDLEEVGKELLKPHTSYVKTVLSLHEEIGLKGVAHITGGGIPGNLPRILPDGLGGKIEKSAIKTPSIFTLIQEKGNIEEDAMFEAFNMGVGMILIVDTEKSATVLKAASGSYSIGEVVKEEGILIQ